MFDRRLITHFDWIFLGLVWLIAAMGILAIYSASQGYPGQPDYWLRQLYWLGLGSLAGFLALLVDFHIIARWAYALHLLILALLLALLVTDTGNQGAVSRWFVIGPVAIQPSEFAKITTILVIAQWFREGRHAAGLRWRGLLVPLGLAALPFALIVQQPDLGTALLLLLSLVPLFIAAGLRWRLMLFCLASGILVLILIVGAFRLGHYRIDDDVRNLLQREGVSAAQIEASGLQTQRFTDADVFTQTLSDTFFQGKSPAILARLSRSAFTPYISKVLHPYQQRRLITFINPGHDPLGAGYHVIQSKVAIGSGGFLGKGYGNSTQGALNFLPARHTDFLFSIFAEEWGFLGAFGLIVLYALLILRGVQIIFETKDRLGAYLVLGVLTIIALQMLINTGMAVGLLPVVGVPLPFFSYGGSSMLSMLLGIALILNVRMRRFTMNS